ncbi:hypothetical protein [Aliarcobacter skirrowii]|uniref:Uncharacterized protein n=1 Tax=Aliarcobacter skirrowii CCUG 10374 TaxID=1032239 RepID=A0AAD0WNQ7_9BACT|nr:hypothetical protein [Aliarcobacter skirrowii]AXX85124.1 hypothetical protein ASKIR_1320 [Aliarcobacter skirrowii CCUG 10374]KAB0620718.1 hypothetical protein F7P70_06165 [Aliarcobacter skirrowii CCUG 10374]RXI25936.1 hypothetical protein CP959_06445 [Aliarcobacter skirrowii CCUG 10374]SUU96350.1 Uncharacterised protein [Aliarcobacter skirrowii]
MKKIIVLIFLVFVFANANNNIIQLRLIDSVSINKSKVARANFASLGNNASSEFRRAIFQGNINYEKLSNGETRTTIVWSTVRDGQKSANVPPFLTKVSSRATSIAGGTVVKAVGNTEELTNAIRNMDNDSSFSDTVKDLTSGNEENLADGGFGNNSANSSESNDSSSSGNSSSGWGGGSSGGGSSGGSGSSGSGSSGGGNTTPPVVIPDSGNNGGSNSGGGSSGGSNNDSSTRYSKCPPIIENGIYTVTEYIDGSCVPTNMSSSIYTTAQGCPQELDFDKNIARISTRTYAMPMGVEILVTPCQKTDKTANLVETHNGCEWKANLDNETANLQKRYFFHYNSEPVYVTQCVNSNKTAPIEQFKGDLGCQPIIDWTGGTYQETASENGLCRPFKDMQKIYYDEEQCQPFVDFEKGYVTIATIPYVNQETGRKYIGACQKTNKTESIKWTNETCSNVIDRKRKIGIEQHRAFYTQNGQKKWLNECGNSENTFELLLFKEYDQACKNKIDYVNKEVYENYRTLTRLDDKVIEVEGCKYEDERQELKSTYEGCKKRHDFQNKKSYEQERFYFMKDGDRQYVSECRDSNIVYNHYNTRATCDIVNSVGKVIVFERNAINLYDDTIEYISECRPISDEIKVEQEFVGYEHDFNHGQSYRLVRDYYIDPVTHDRKYLTNAVRDNKNFPHIKEAGNWEHNDELKHSVRKLRISFIDTVLNKKIYPNGEDFFYSEPVAYSVLFVGEKIGSKFSATSPNVTLSNGTYYYNGNAIDRSLKQAISHIHQTSNRSGCGYEWGGDDSSHYLIPTGMGAYGLGCYNAGWNGSGYTSSYGYQTNLETITNISEYLRIDGTKLTITNSTRYRAVP